jgi:hypothetical protein
MDIVMDNIQRCNFEISCFYQMFRSYQRIPHVRKTPLCNIFPKSGMYKFSKTRNSMRQKWDMKEVLQIVRATVQDVAVRETWRRVFVYPCPKSSVTSQPQEHVASSGGVNFLVHSLRLTQRSDGAIHFTAGLRKGKASELHLHAVAGQKLSRRKFCVSKWECTTLLRRVRIKWVITNGSLHIYFELLCFPTPPPRPQIALSYGAPSQSNSHFIRRNIESDNQVVKSAVMRARV